MPFTVGGDSDAPAVVTTDTGQRFTVTPGSPVPGGAVAFDGSGFAPDADGQNPATECVARRRRAVACAYIPTAPGNFHDETAWPDYATLPPDTYSSTWSSAPRRATCIRVTRCSRVSVRIGETILLALMGTVFGVLISVPLSFLGARNLMGGSAVGRAVYSVVRMVFTITRSVEVLILGVIMVVIVGIGSYAGVLAIVVHTVGSLGKLYAESIESIEPGPIEAITATGAEPRVRRCSIGVVPQIVPNFLAVTIYWWDHNVRMSTVLGLVGGGGIGYLLIQYMNLLQFNQAATVLWLIVIVVLTMDYASGFIRSRLV